MVGRERERDVMLQCLDSSQSELIAILGRRRVGKTFLIRNVYSKNMAFEITGIQNGTKREQFQNFSNQLVAYFNLNPKTKRPTSWLGAFALLSSCMEQSKSKNKKVIFFDELPWIAETSKTKFIEALGHFWNNWAVKNKVVIVICGSAASWIVKHIINAKGGLYNRVTKKIFLKPFTLYETNKFLIKKNIFVDEHSTLQLYMALGGIPHYLNQMESNKSIAENLTEICFNNTGLLHNEFDNLYEALFLNHEQYVEIIKALANSKKGLSRQEIIQSSGIPDGGTLTQMLKDLVQCDFILEQNPFNQKKRFTVYRLIDEFSLFYLRFIQGKNTTTKNYWTRTMATSEYKIWAGYAFENICFRHQHQIILATKLEAIQTEFSSFYHSATKELPGAQIDMVLDRADQVINLFEIKFYKEPLIITKDMAQNLRTKMAIFRAATKTKSQIFISLVSVYGIVDNQYSNGLLAHNIGAADLFMK
ncbi:MAG: ATP-binding protein [Saprospiraceae bacterium]|nr:ATP-binding protein [Saprospiraceae bacterium]